MILITGGAGYIGSHTALRLLEAGKEIVLLDNFSTSAPQRILDMEKISGVKIPYYEADICDAQALDRILSDCDIEAVMHFAAFSVVGESMKRPVRYYKNNVCGTACLVDAMLKHGVYKLIFSSTAAVYGQPESLPVSEDAPLTPSNTYGETKLAVEKMLRCAQAEGLRYVSLRYFNACGAHKSGMIGEAHNPETHLIPLVLQAAAGKRDKVYIFGDDYPTRDGTCVRDYIHVTDLADAHAASLELLDSSEGSEVFNLGNGKGFTVWEIIQKAMEITGKSIPVEIASKREGDPAVLTASSKKAERVLGWKPQFDKIEDIIRSAWCWHGKGAEL